MNKESLEILRNKIFEIIDDTRIPILEKTELLINIMNFLDPNEYENNIKILKKHQKKD